MASETQSLPNNQLACRLCKVNFTDKPAYREHFKVSWHVENKKREIGGRRALNLTEYDQMRSLDHASDEDSQSRGDFQDHCPTCDKSFRSEKSYRSHFRNCGAQLESLDAAASGKQDLDDNRSDSSSDETSLFDETICLFCLHESPDLELNMRHMGKEHGFLIHSPDKITDLEVYLYWLHLDINEFFSCINCDATRKSAEGIRHHMVAKGHCKTTIEAEAEFYDGGSTKTTPNLGDLSFKASASDDDTVTLLSGKQISNRLAPKARTRVRSRSPSQKEMELIADSATEEPQSAGSKEMRVTIRGSDSMALAGLSSLEVRSLRKKEVKMLSAERRARNENNRKVEKIGNRQKHFRMDVPGLLNG